MLRTIGITVGAIVLFALAYFGCVELLTDPKVQDLGLHAEVIAVDKGFGYQIYHGEQLFIQQEFIPALQGSKQFVSPQDAKRVAKLVMEKITKRASPEITLQEIEALDVVILED